MKAAHPLPSPTSTGRTPLGGNGGLSLCALNAAEAELSSYDPLSGGIQPAGCINDGILH
jgi:hypothetical protein